MRISRDNAWVPATVSSRNVDPVIDNIDSPNEGETSEVFFLSLPYELVKRFGGYDVVALRTSPQEPPLIIGVQKLKRISNQLILKRCHCGSMLPDYEIGTTSYVAPFVNAKTWSVELKEAQELVDLEPALLEKLLMLQCPVAPVPEGPRITPFEDSKVYDHAYPMPYNLSLKVNDAAGPPRKVHDPLPRPSPTATAPRQRTLWPQDPYAGVVNAVQR